MTAFDDFVRDAEQLIDDPHAVGERLKPLLAADGWLAPQHRQPGHVEVLVPPAQNIHYVEAAGPGKTISIHVYGADIERLGSSILRVYDDAIAWPRPKTLAAS